ncbi:uncharacterized protein JCM6883_007016 [Sporobolomyces salmoneus]|uniref:uncharacterized protein n=1 Tax=Sporobolomyces salmoneus TaxID=183962 RepID=UPI003178D257
MEGAETTTNGINREDATTQPAQQVKFTLSGDKFAEAPSSILDSSAVPSPASASTSANLPNDQNRNSTNSETLLSNGTETKENGQDTDAIAMGDAVVQEGDKVDRAIEAGSSEVNEVKPDGVGNSTLNGNAEEPIAGAKNHLRTRTEELAQPASDSIQPDTSPVIPSETPSRAPSPAPREATPALSEAPSDTPSTDSTSAGPPPPEPSAFNLSHPLSAYQFSNTTLVPVASTSTNPFHFVSWPPQPLEDSWDRTRLPGDDELDLVHDPEPGYRATPAEIEASRIRQEEKQAKIQAARLAAQTKGKGKAKEPASKPPRARAMERLASGEASSTTGQKRVAKKSALQQVVQREPSPERPKPLVTKTRYPRDLAMGELISFSRLECRFGTDPFSILALVPNDLQTATPAGIIPHRDFVDLFALPPHYITEEGFPPKPLGTSNRQRATSAKSQPAPTSNAAPTSNRPSVLASTSATASASAKGQPRASTAVKANSTAKDTVSEANGTKRNRERTDEGTGGPKKKAKEESIDPESPSAYAPLEPLDPGTAVEWVTQTTTCLSKKLDGQLRCFQCVARAIGHGCCFIGVRSFGVDASGQIVTPPAFLDTKVSDDIPRFTKTLVSPLTDQYNQLMRTWLAGSLLPIIKAEQSHAENSETKRERLDLSVHSVCDTCNTSILGAEWMCSTCGRVACSTCHEALVKIERQEHRRQKVDWNAVDVQRRKKCMAKKRLDKGGVGEFHRSDQFVPMTRLDKKDLAQLRADLYKWNTTHAIVPTNGAAKKFLDTTFLTSSPLPAYDPMAHSVHHIPAKDMNAAVFLELWNYSVPLLITDVDLAGLKKWTPSYISNRFPNLEVQLQNNKGSEMLVAKVPYFFSQFNEDGGPQRSADVKQTFRTKDFPSAKQFKNEFKELADEFYRILPLGDIIHPDGPLNYLAHAPVNAAQPDVGPHATNSWAADAATGTTLLRTDVTDVANLMYWCHHDEATGRELRIRWDVYKAEDADKLRDFCWELLTKKLPKGTSAVKFRETHDDPLLSPCLYLNQRQREILAQTKGVSSFPIYQYPGQLVLIPAGSPYQVSSWSDHLNLTTQFLAGPRVPQAIAANDAARRETKERALWRSDNVQLERQLLYAWYSCQYADKKYVPSPLDWKPRGVKTAEELAREAAKKNGKAATTATPAT